MQHGYAPEGGKRITAHHCRVAKGVNGIVILLPILGECWLRTVPKALPWADLFWPSRPCLPQPSILPSLLLPFLGEVGCGLFPRRCLGLTDCWPFGPCQFRRICYPPAWSMRIYYPINNEEPTPAHPKGGSLNEAQYSLTSHRLSLPSLGEGLGVGVISGGCSAGYCGLKILIFSSGG